MGLGTVWLVGATGLTGRDTLRELLASEEVARVVAWVRRPTGTSHAKLSERVVDFERLEAAFASARAPGRASIPAPEEVVDAAICCLGTTIKAAGSKERFRRVDHDYVLAFARAAKMAGARTFVVVTALGADSSSAFFYNRVKGDVEEDLTSLAFDSLVIARPSLLVGERSESRLGEQLMGPIARFLPARYRAITSACVARALVRLALAPPGKSPRRVVLSDELQILGG
jgi:uncharacterized protein YbjT (DUF2867 family)